MKEHVVRYYFWAIRLVNYKPGTLVPGSWLDTLTNGLYVIEDVLQQAAEQNREQQSQRLLNEFKAAIDLRK